MKYFFLPSVPEQHIQIQIKGTLYRFINIKEKQFRVNLFLLESLRNKITLSNKSLQNRLQHQFEFGFYISPTIHHGSQNSIHPKHILYLAERYPYGNLFESAAN